MKKEDFAKIVSIAIDKLPEAGKRAMKNVVFFIEPEVRKIKANEIGIKKGEILLGLYEGIPKAKRGSGYFGVLPDKITIFQEPIEIICSGDPERIRQEVYRVVYHEVGHHLGFDEEGIRIKELSINKKHEH